MEAWTSEKGALKSLKKMDKPPKTTKGDSERATQIEAALRKYNPNILNRINSENSVVEIEKQRDNPFVTNEDEADLDDKAEDMEDSELAMSSRIRSPNPKQYSSKSLSKKLMLIKPNHKEGWKTVVHRTKRHVLFVQTLNIPEKIMEKKVASQKKVLVRDIPLDISNKEVGAVMKKFGEIKNIQIKVARKWQSVVVEYINQKEANRAVNQWSTMVRKDAVRIYLIINTQKTIKQRKTWKAKLIKARTCFILRTSKNYIRMGCAYIGFNSEISCNSTTIKPLVIGDTLVHWVSTDAKECHFYYQKEITKKLSTAKLYVRRKLLVENHMPK
ncbi:hypothetical protein G9A89_020654 [Geosiphon pyriformis]|nr:hypothetical protein G9A89_020654 [Geosiphon pyriformis]